jgi:hypothetical protein
MISLCVRAGETEEMANVAMLFEAFIIQKCDRNQHRTSITLTLFTRGLRSAVPLGWMKLGLTGAERGV